MKIFLVTLLITIPFVSVANDYSSRGPLAFKNQNPLYLEFLNIEPTGASVLARNNFSFRVDNTYSNVFEIGASQTNDLLIDAEVLRTALHFNYGIYDDMELGLEIPFIRFDTGFLDGFLQKYHKSFGFPNGGRETVSNGSFTYRLIKNGTAIYRVNQEDFNLGDIILNFKHNFIKEEKIKPSVAWLFYFKFPTGDRGEGLGSGNPDFGFAAALEKNYKRFHGFLNLGYFVNGGQDPIQKYIYDVYFSYVIGGEFSISHPVSVVAQIYGGTPLLRGTGMQQLDDFPMDLQIGFKGEHPLKEKKNIRLTWQTGFSEDINPNGPSIDFTVLGSVGIKFGIK